MGLPDADTAVILITDKHEPDVMIADGFHSVMHLCVADIVQPDIDNAKAIIDFAATRNCSHLLVYCRCFGISSAVVKVLVERFGIAFLMKTEATAARKTDFLIHNARFQRLLESAHEESFATNRG